MTNFFRWLGGPAMLIALAAFSAVPAQDKAKPADKHDHPDHGPHKGALAEWGEEEYHVEFTVDHTTQTATVFILDGTAKAAKPIDAKDLVLTLKQKPAVTVKLQASPQPGDPAGKASRYVGKHAALGKEQEFT